MQLTHERDLISRGITSAAGLPKTGFAPNKSHPGGDGGGPGSGGGGGGGGTGSGGVDHGGPPGTSHGRNAEAFALEMQVGLS